ncbi:MAG TPA: PIN domain-containing protein [Candidatus Obscuribacterales bacterium]
MILLDTSGLLSALDESQKHHAQCRDVLMQSSAPLLLSPFVLAELDYLLMRYLGRQAQSLLLREVARGAYELAPFSAGDIWRAREIMDRYGDLDLGLADASIVVLAERHSVTSVLTLDERHFRALRVNRKHFILLPFDRKQKSF